MKKLVMILLAVLAMPVAGWAFQANVLAGPMNGQGMSILLVTHNPEWVFPGIRHWTMHEGRLAPV